MKRCTKIVATIGPASHDEHTILSLLQNGLNVARLNFSHGTHEDHARVYRLLRETAQKLNRSVTIMQDLQGPKIRTGDLRHGSVELVPGEPFTLTTKDVIGDSSRVSVDLPILTQCLDKGSMILLDDGNLELQVLSIGDEEVETRIIQGGTLYPHKGVNLPGATIDIPSMTDKDKEDLEFGVGLGVDAVAVSFVRTSDDVNRVREAIKKYSGEKAKFIPIIAKLERREALNNLEAIVQISDGVMVARGDLGVEMPPESVPIAQKKIIDMANRHSKIVITATQMLDSMIHNPRPTRAEASDVANAIFDGTDAVMLSGETAVGEYPIHAVKMMNAIALQAESQIDRWGHWHGPQDTQSNQDDTYYMTLAARELAHDRNVAAIAIFTKSGRTALMMSKTRPGVPILAFTPEIDTYHRMQMYWGVTPYKVPHADSIEEMLQEVEQEMLSSDSIKSGQQVVLICGFPVREVRPTNLALLHTVGE
ncbi:MAG: pyruvate kinase [Anaerolineales bacterium]